MHRPSGGPKGRPYDGDHRDHRDNKSWIKKPVKFFAFHVVPVVSVFNLLFVSHSFRESPMLPDLDSLHSLTLETQTGESLATDASRKAVEEAVRSLVRAHPGARILQWRSQEHRLDLLLDLGRSDEDVLRMVLDLKRTIRNRLGGGLQWKWGYEDLIGADPGCTSQLKAAWGLD